MEIARISREAEYSVADVGRSYFALADEVDFAWLLDLLDMAPGEDVWEQRAAQGLMQDLGQARRNLTLGLLSVGGPDLPTDERLARFKELHGARLAAMRETLAELLDSEHINLAALTVATREVLRESTFTVA
jgi:NAD-specific glutamate dehydrogenase